MNLLAQFIYLQLLDALTTIAFMMQGVGESNPLVRWVMRATPDPITGLFLLKAVGVALAIVCLLFARTVVTTGERVLCGTCRLQSARLDSRQPADQLELASISSC